MLDKLISTLTPDERASLKDRCKKNESQLHKLINALLLNPAASSDELKKSFGINGKTYFKNLNLAKEEVFDVIKKHMHNAYDDVLLPNVLYRRGLEVYASKLRLKLAAEYEKYGWWNVLQETYTMEMMVAYSKCDIPALEKVRVKILKNQERVNRYVVLDKELIVQMAIIEKGELKEKEFPAFEKKLKGLMKDAVKLGHHIPIFNAVHASYVFYSKYLLDIDKAGAIIADIPGYLKKHGDSIIPYTRSVSWLNMVNFMTDFGTSQQPEQYFKEVEKAIGNHGLLFDTQAVLNFCYYYFLQKNTVQFEKYFNRFQKLPTDKSFHYKVTFLNCLKAYLNKDLKTFSTQRNLFYTDSKNREYNDYDLIIRYLEILLLLRSREIELADHKLMAAIKFGRRNFTTSRIKLEKEHWHILGAAIQSKMESSKPKSVFRFTEFMLKELEEIPPKK